jgi:hypothetical protein
MSYRVLSHVELEFQCTSKPSSWCEENMVHGILMHNSGKCYLVSELWLNKVLRIMNIFLHKLDS